MKQIKNSRVITIATSLVLMASACAVGGSDQASGESEEVIATETETELTTSDDNALSLGFRPEATLEDEDGDEGVEDDDTTTSSRSTTTTSSRSTTRPATTAELRPPTIAERQTTAAETTAPTTAPTTATDTTTPPVTFGDPTVGRWDEPKIITASARLTNNRVPVRGTIHCHFSWNGAQWGSGVLVQATLFKDGVDIGSLDRRVPCGEDGLAVMLGDISTNPHGVETRIIFDNVADGPEGNLNEYQVSLKATNPRNNKSVTAGRSSRFVKWIFQIAEQRKTSAEPDGWTYFGNGG